MRLQSDRIIKHDEINLEQPLQNLDLKVEKKDEKKDDRERESDNDADTMLQETTKTGRRKMRMMVKTWIGMEEGGHIIRWARCWKKFKHLGLYKLDFAKLDLILSLITLFEGRTRYFSQLISAYFILFIIFIGVENALLLDERELFWMYVAIYYDIC